MIEVMARSRRGLPYERRLSREEAKGMTLSDPDFDPDGTWLVEMDDLPIGFAFAIVDSSRIRAGKDEGYIDVDVVPESRGMGIELQLLDMSVTYLRGRGVNKALSRCPIADGWRKSLLVSKSFSEYYRVYGLVRKGQPEVPAPKLPEGFSVERKLLVDCSDAEVASLVEAFNEAFFDHPRFAPESPERFMIWRDTHPDPILISKVRKDNATVGFCISEESKSFNNERGARTGWIIVLGVRPEARRKGLARVIIADGIEWLVDRGMDTVNIGVVSENDRALDLYKSLGFEKEHETIWYQRPTKD